MRTQLGAGAGAHFEARQLAGRALIVDHESMVEWAGEWSWAGGMVAVVGIGDWELGLGFGVEEGTLDRAVGTSMACACQLALALAHAVGLSG